jgi:RimJ/RimL family protein N-acetyltransferase
MTRSIPNINTARLTLRGMRPEDFDSFAALWAMPDVVRHITGTPWSRGRAWESFLRNAGHWQMTGFGQWAVIEQRSRRMIGQTGFFYGAQSLGDDFDAFPEAGWVLTTQAHQTGYGQEAAMAAHDWFDRIIPGPLVARIAEGNEPSRKLATLLGYRTMRHVDMDGDSVLLMRRNGPPARSHVP